MCSDPLHSPSLLLVPLLPFAGPAVRWLLPETGNTAQCPLWSRRQQEEDTARLRWRSRSSDFLCPRAGSAVPTLRVELLSWPEMFLAAPLPGDSLKLLFLITISYATMFLAKKLLGWKWLMQDSAMVQLGDNLTRLQCWSTWPRDRYIVLLYFPPRKYVSGNPRARSRNGPSSHYQNHPWKFCHCSHSFGLNWSRKYNSD